MLPAKFGTMHHLYIESAFANEYLSDILGFKKQLGDMIFNEEYATVICCFVIQCIGSKLGDPSELLKMCQSVLGHITLFNDNYKSGAINVSFNVITTCHSILSILLDDFIVFRTSHRFQLFDISATIISSN